MPVGVAIYGGFFGEEVNRADRDWVVHETVLSGDIGRDDTFNPFLFNTPNAGHVLTATELDESAVLDGLIIEHGGYGPSGLGAGHPLMYGSGLYSIDSSPTVRHCVFRYNYAAFASGGAVYINGGDAHFTDCSFENNYVHLGNGGGVMLYGTGGGEFIDCSFTNNTCVHASGDASGGGIYHDSQSPLTVTRCFFEGNIIRPFYSQGSDYGYGGGISSFYAPITVTDSVFRNNRATIGGGMVAWDQATVVNCLFDGNEARARENSITEAGGFGGGFCAYGFVPEPVNVINSTFVNNFGKEHGGVSAEWNAEVTVRNSVFSNNSGWNPEFIGYFREEIGGNFDIAYCNIPMIFGPPALGEDPLEPDKLVGCTDVDPMFVGGEDYRLAAGSPVIDAGDSTAWAGPGTFDHDGSPRFVDDAGTPDTGVGPAPVIDMGAYEFQVAIACFADCDGSGALNVDDIDCFVSAFLASDLSITDCDGTGTLNVDDIDCFVTSFLAGCP